jgi:hypothetical protein
VLPPRPRLLAIAVGAAALLIVAALAYLLLPQLGAALASDSLDTANLPNAGRIAAGTPVTDIPGLHVTPVAVSGVQVTPIAQPTPVAQATPAQNAPSNSAGPLFEDHFTSNDANWPSDPQGIGLITNGAYRLVTRQAAQFVAVGAPLANVPADVLVHASFRKLGGPAGGGYGIIVRNQDASALDGKTQDGHYYVLEVGDTGDIGIWRRDGDHWVDLQPWQRSDAVKTGIASNDLSVRAVGNTLTLYVNGTPVATRTDATLARGTAGLFVGGDGNQVAVSDFSIQTP